MKKYGIAILIFCFFIFYGNLGRSAAEDDLKAKLQEKLLELKRTVLQEQALLRSMNEKLLKENQRLTQECNQANPMPGKKEEKISQLQAERIRELEKRVAQLNGLLESTPPETTQNKDLEQKLSQLNNMLEIKTQEVTNRDKQITNLQQLAENADQQNKKLEQEVALLSDSLKTKQDLTKGTQNQQEKFQQELQAKVEQIGSLKQDIQKSTNEINQLKLDLQLAENNKAKLSGQINLLENELKAKPKEKVVYQTDTSQQKRIQELEQKALELNNSLQDKTQQIAEKDQQISNLKKGLDDAYERVKNIIGEYTR